MDEVIKDNLIFTLSSLSYGGLEKVVSLLSNYLADDFNYSITIIVLTKKEKFFKISDKIVVHEPDFNYKDYNRIIFTIKTFLYLRSQLTRLKSKAIFTFGGRYNSLCLLSSIGLKNKIYVAERSQPSKSHGFIIDKLNKFFYQFAHGIIVQTKFAKNIFEAKYPTKNIFVIPNPVKVPYQISTKKSNIILNVGRFIHSKNQAWLISLFCSINPEGWELHFVGDGPELEKCRFLAKRSDLKDKIIFHGKQKDVVKFYQESKIFAFTSTSEGFPNVLLEAMSYGNACVSFDCEAGPSDIIIDNFNGYLVPNLNKKEYREKLHKLINDNETCERFSIEARKTVENYSIENISKIFLELVGQ
jgi:glycosyltransferase involved in cell wall biosynthesis